MPLWSARGPAVGTPKWIGYIFVVALLVVTIVVGGCSFANFVAAAEADLPVVIQMVSNITSIVAPGVSVAIQAAGGLTLASLQLLCGSPVPGSTKCDATSLVGQYQASPDSATQATLLQKIDAALTTANAHITEMLSLAKGLPQAVGASIVVGIGLALQTVVALISLVPVAKVAAAGNRKASATLAKAVLPPKPHELKAAFNTAIGQSFPAAMVH
jgi:hypothetical protein